MSDQQEQERDQHQPSIVEEVQSIPVQVSIDHRLSLLQLDQMDPTAESDVTAPSDAEPYQASVTAPSPTRNTTPLKRRSPSSSFSPPLQQPTESDRQILSEGYLVFPLQAADNDRAFQPILRRCNSLSSSTGNTTPERIPSSEVAAFVENLTRRSLFPSPVNGSSGNAGLPPPHPLTRTISDPMPFSSLENPILPENNPGPRTDLAQENPSSAGERAFQPILRRCNSLSSSTGNNIPAGIPNSEVAAFAENLTRRALFPSPVNGTAGLPPPHPLTRTNSDPISSLENPILPPPREKNPGSRKDFAQENQSSKRLKRGRFNRIHQRMRKLMDEIDEDPPESEAILADDQVMNYGGGSEEVAAQELKTDIAEVAGNDEAPPEAESTVSAERIGDCTALEFKCRCGSGYSIRIVGHDCYYKLI